MELDEIIRLHLGEFGRYNIWVFALVFTLRFAIVAHNLGFMIFAATPPHWCSFTHSDGEVNMTLAEWKELAIPKTPRGQYESCLIYPWAKRNNWTMTELNSTLTSIRQNPDSLRNLTVKCDKYEYDLQTHVSSSVVTQWDMVCDRQWMRSMVASMFVVGSIVGTQLTGYFTDRWGRARVLFYANVGSVVFGLILPFCFNYVAFLVVRACVGAFSSGSNIIAYTIVIEMTSVRLRSAVGHVFFATWPLMIIVMSAAAVGLRTWFMFLLILAIPPVLTLVSAWFIPESLPWLVAKGHQQRALQGLQKVARWNRKQLPADMVLTVQKEKKKMKTRYTDLIRTANLRRVTVIVGYLWVLVAAVYFNISWNTADLQGNLYINAMLFGLTELPGNMLCIPLLQYAGRRFSIMLCFLLTGVAYLVSLATSGVATQALVLTARFFVNMTYTMVYQYTPEVFPTVVRTLSLSYGKFMVFLGAFCASYMPLMGVTTSTTVSGVACLVGGAAMLLVPETLNVPLPSTVAEAESNSYFSLKSILVFPFLKSDKRQPKETDEIIIEAEQLVETTSSGDRGGATSQSTGRGEI